MTAPERLAEIRARVRGTASRWYRTDVPYLLALVDQLTAERDRARDWAAALEAENAAALALHWSYWIDSDGHRHESTGIAYCGQFDGCDGTDENPCPVEEHEVPVCSSCGTYDDYGEAGFRLWPCPTARALLVSELAEVAQEGRTE